MYMLIRGPRTTVEVSTLTDLLTAYGQYFPVVGRYRLRGTFTKKQLRAARLPKDLRERLDIIGDGSESRPVDDSERWLDYLYRLEDLR